MVTFTHNGIFKFTHKGRTVIIDGVMSTEDESLIDKCRSFKLQELKPKVKKTNDKHKRK